MAEMAKAQSSLPSLQNLDLDYSNLSKSFAGIEGIWSEKTLLLGSLLLSGLPGSMILPTYP